MSRKLSIYVTLSFWACIGMAWINLVLLFIAEKLHSKPLLMLSVLTLAVCLLGAACHWMLDARHKRQR